MGKKIKIVELFAGVGGFRIGLDKACDDKTNYETVWANQYEPSTSRQHASEVYVARFGEDGFDGRNIESVIESDFECIPNHDLLVGGFPCQDYSVASTLKNSHGLIGKKGVLFWSIYTILKRKGDKAPDYLFLENVDRLLKSPSKQRGKDFAVMLASLSDLGYAIEWRVVNAAEYGFPQRRRRVFIVGYKKGTKLYEKAKKAAADKWLTKDGVLADAFPGIMIDRVAITGKVSPAYDGESAQLKDVLIDEKDVPEEFFIPEDKLAPWTYLKGAKKEERKTSTGHVYHYAEGAMVFPDALDKPSRTIITGEGGTGASRFKHVVKTPSGRYRRLVPLELERLNMFPDNHTKLDNVSDGKRAFFMGNALVVGAIERVGRSLSKKR
jgi:DNA (cytosine-5)-methyltransferase 1